MEYIEIKYVSETYDFISEHFSETRYSLWNYVKKYIEKIIKIHNSNNKNKINFLDYGCGNGKYLSLFDKKDANCIGFDYCEKLLSIVKNKYHHVQTIRGDICEFNINLTNKFDSIISIAVLHHLSNEYRRIEAIKNIIKYLKINGSALISVWSTNLDTSKYKKLETKNDWLIGWNNKYYRYYHLFEKNELENLILKADSNNQIKIIDVFYELSNWFIEIKKI